MQIYSQLIAQYQTRWSQLVARYNLVSGLRLLLVVLFIGLLYYFTLSASLWVIGAMLLNLIGFLFLMKYHERIDFQKQLTKAKLTINEQELAYLENKVLAFEDGEAFQNVKHPYSYDIDVFGKNSLFQHLNRTATFKGKAKLAQLLESSQRPKPEIEENQAAVAELSQKLDWRQHIYALGTIQRDQKEVVAGIVAWCQQTAMTQAVLVRLLSYLMPLLLLATLISFGISQNDVFLTWAGRIFVINLFILYTQLKPIRQQIVSGDRVKDIVKQYGLIIQAIEEEEFVSPKLKGLKAKLKYPNGLVSQQLARLSMLLNNLDSIQNLLGAVVFNGLFLYHLHSLRSLHAWKKQYAPEISKWLEIIAELEALNSLANFAHNNPDFAFPEINENQVIEFKGIAHPLLDAKNRIGNDIAFQPQPFFVLTGSNMSGKSTFLRSLAVNMLLASTGSVVCARSAKVHPLPIWVSMRLSDSLSENESYFFAEVKRIRTIIDALENGPAFVLLDELLRGTNSDDKRQGTIEVLQKMVEKKAIGVIATHDLEVCNTTEEYPEYLSNQCFEAKIVEDDLFFDYILRPGICKNKSATFLMKKIGIF